MVVGWDSGEFSKAQKKTMEGIAKRRQQRKIFRGKTVYILSKEQPMKKIWKKFSQLESSDNKNFIFKLAKRIKHEN